MSSKSGYKIIFAGTPDFAATILQDLLRSEHEVVAVYTQPDRPAGRGRHLTMSPVKQVAVDNQLLVAQPTSLRDPDIQQAMQALQADLMIVAAYGLILPQAVLDIPRLGCLNIHFSLLPRWRGAAPMLRAIQAGDRESGVGIMQMDAGLDTGTVLSESRCAIEAEDTHQTLCDRLTGLGSDVLLQTLDKLQKNSLTAKVQDESLATYAHKVKKSEAKINWQDSAEQIERNIRAFNPWPVAFTELQAKTCRIWQAELLDGEQAQGAPGQIISATDQGIDVNTGKGKLRLLKLQLSGGKVLSCQQILNSRADWFIDGHFL